MTKSVIKSVSLYYIYIYIYISLCSLRRSYLIKLYLVIYNKIIFIEVHTGIYSIAYILNGVYTKLHPIYTNGILKFNTKI